MDIPIDLQDNKTKVVRVILDVAHNPQAMEYLMSKLRRTYPNLRNNVCIVVGMSADKDLKQCTDTLLNYLDGDVTKLHLVAASHPRAASVERILECNPILMGAITTAANAELVIVCGSVFIMVDARKELGIVEPRDSKVIAAVAGAGLQSSQENFGHGNVTLKQ
jgi:dihydrofolate synthase/folylpolyglutamate synthase